MRHHYRSPIYLIIGFVMALAILRLIVEAIIETWG